MSTPIGSVSAINASLTLVLLDRASAPAWKISVPQPDGHFSPGHPAEILDGDDDVHVLDVGGRTALAMTLEGMTGVAEVFRLGPDRLAFVEPGKDWWLENFGQKAKKVDALFAELLGGDVPEDAEEVGELEITSGQLVAFDMWNRLESLPAQEGEIRGECAGAVVALPAGKYRVSRHVVEVDWADDAECAVAYVVPIR